MTYWRAKMFNRKAASPKSMPERVLSSLPLRPGDSVADIGAGGGYFTIRMAGKVGEEGVVYAVDTDRRSLDHIMEDAERSRVRNVKLVQTDGGAPELPDSGIDLIFMRNVLHHISNPVGYLRDLKRSLKSQGVIAIIDYNENGRFSFHGLFHHSVGVDDLLGWMGEAGFGKAGSFDFLPEQSFTLFKPMVEIRDEKVLT